MDHIVIEGITKSFGAFRALDDVSLNVKRGDIHAILGENGAGKTTLMNILYGLYQPDRGRIILDGRPVTLASPKHAIELGIGMIHQHFMLVNSLTVVENIVLGLERGFKAVDIAAHGTRILEMSRGFGFDIDPAAEVWTLPMGTRQRVVRAARRPRQQLAPQRRSSTRGADRPGRHSWLSLAPVNGVPEV